MAKKFKDTFLGAIKFMIATTTWAAARGVKLLVGGSVACTNKEVVILPTLPDDDETLIVKARGYADHESAHIEETDFSVANDRWRQLFEDVRIEKCRIKKYPGSAINLKKLVDILVAEEKFSAPPDDHIGMLLMASVCRARTKFLQQMALLPNAKKAEKFCRKTFGNKFTDMVFSIVDRVDKTKSTMDCRKLADEVIALIGSASANPEQFDGSGNPSGDGEPDQSSDGSGKAGKSEGTEQPLDAAGDSSEDGKPDQSSDGSGKSDKSEGTDQSSDGSGKSDGSDQSSDGSAQQDDSVGDPGGTGAGGKTRKNLQSLKDAEPKVETDLGKILEKDLNAAAQQMYGQPRFPKTVYPDNVPCSSKAAMAARTALNKSRQLGAQLAGLFAAHNAKHCGGKENGQRLNRHRLHLLAVNTPDIRVFVDNQQRKAENTAIALLIDASGSMAEHIDLAVHAAYVVAKCLQNLKGIATTVAAFPYGDDEHVLEVKSFNLPPVFDRFGQVYANNNTPTAEVVMWGIQRLFPRKEERKIMIIFTDGRPNSYTSAQRAVKKAMELGIEVYVIALNDSTKGKNKGFIDENLISPIARIEDLGSAIINLLRSALIKRAA